jgi:NhaB family Na+:H+ antiporter
MAAMTPGAFWANFLGDAPAWYKRTVLAFLVINPVLALAPFAGPFVTGWLLVLEFIFCLAMALRCYPLQPGGLLALEAVIIGLTDAQSVRDEVFNNFPVILLLMFMVAGIYFMRDLLLFTFTKILLGFRSKILLALWFCAISAFLSAFLDALTVTAVIISVATGFYAIFHRVASGFHFSHDHDHTHDGGVIELHRADLDAFRGFLCSLLMHGAVGTAIGGVCTMVGEPQNLLIADKMGWHFAEYFTRMAPVTIPVMAIGLLTCALLEKTRRFGYGGVMPDHVRAVLLEADAAQKSALSDRGRMQLLMQAVAALFLIVALAFHWAEVGLIGLAVIVVQTAFNGVIEEHRIGRAFEEALPFTALLVVFFVIVAVIHEQHLFTPIIDFVLHLDEAAQPPMLYVANGLLSSISDNVFVATVYIEEVERHFVAGEMTRAHLDQLAIAINTGTNIPSIATPNGQAAFLFLLTSSIAPLVRLSYAKMVVMALPYTITMGLTGLVCVHWLL